MNPKLTNERLRRRAIVYLRQSSPEQVFQNQESQRRQYGLAGQARELGFREVLVIDEDLGRTGSGLVERPGFQRLVAEVCSGEVGAVFCIEASRAGPKRSRLASPDLALRPGGHRPGGLRWSLRPQPCK